MLAGSVAANWATYRAGDAPADGDVRYGVPNAGSTGTCFVPVKGKVQRGTRVDVSDWGELPKTEGE